MSELQRKNSSAKVNESPKSKGAGPAPRASGHTPRPSESSDLRDVRKKTDTLAKAYEVIRKRVLIPPETEPSLDALAQGLLFCAELSNQPLVKELLCAFSTYASSMREALIVDSITSRLTPLLEDTTEARRRLDELSDAQEKMTTDLDGVAGRLASEVRKLHRG